MDVFSRKIIYLVCCDSNKSSTVLQLFIEGRIFHGLSSVSEVIREGKMWRLLDTARDLERGSFIAAISIHNQKIERQWVNVYLIVTQIYLSLLIS